MEGLSTFFSRFPKAFRVIPLDFFASSSVLGVGLVGSFGEVTASKPSTQTIEAPILHCGKEDSHKIAPSTVEGLATIERHYRGRPAAWSTFLAARRWDSRSDHSL